MVNNRGNNLPRGSKRQEMAAWVALSAAFIGGSVGITRVLDNHPLIDPSKEADVIGHTTKGGTGHFIKVEQCEPYQVRGCDQDVVPVPETTYKAYRNGSSIVLEAAGVEYPPER